MREKFMQSKLRMKVLNFFSHSEWHNLNICNKDSNKPCEHRERVEVNEFSFFFSRLNEILWKILCFINVWIAFTFVTFLNFVNNFTWKFFPTRLSGFGIWSSRPRFMNEESVCACLYLYASIRFLNLLETKCNSLPH